MALAPGTRVGPYEVLAPLGAGGMGEVYRARDPRLGRDVALKVLPAAVAQDPDRLRRFEVEARAAGALNHPALLAVFDVGEDDGIRYVVSELLQGETLRERLGAGGLPAAQGARLRDPGRARPRRRPREGDRPPRPEAGEPVRHRGTGGPRSSTSAWPSSWSASRSPIATTPTRTHDSTDAGVVLGTAGYMSPEQVRGLPADARSDIFAFGAVLYEMLARRRAFPGETAAETMTAVLRDEPPSLEQIDPTLPPAVDRVVKRCLEKRAGGALPVRPRRRLRPGGAVRALRPDSGRRATAAARGRRRAPAALAVIACRRRADRARRCRGVAPVAAPSRPNTRSSPSAAAPSRPRASRPTARPSSTARPGKAGRRSSSRRGPTAASRARSGSTNAEHPRHLRARRWRWRSSPASRASFRSAAPWRASRSAAALRGSMLEDVSGADWAPDGTAPRRGAPGGRQVADRVSDRQGALRDRRLPRLPRRSRRPATRWRSSSSPRATPASARLPWWTSRAGSACWRTSRSWREGPFWRGRAARCGSGPSGTRGATSIYAVTPSGRKRLVTRLPRRHPHRRRRRRRPRARCIAPSRARARCSRGRRAPAPKSTSRGSTPRTSPTSPPTAACSCSARR